MMFSSEPDFRLLVNSHSTQLTELPLHQAVSHGSPDVVKTFLRGKPLNLDVQDHCGDTPLQFAVQSRCLRRQHAVTRLETVTLQRLFAAPGIDVNICVAGQSPLSTAATHGCVNAVAMRLKVEGVENNGRGLTDPPICRGAARGHLEVVGLLVQQCDHLNIKESTITSCDTARFIAARDGDLEMVRVLLGHDQIDVNLKNRWLKDPLILAAKGGHLSIVNGLLWDRRQKGGSLRRSLDSARNDCIRSAFRSRIEDHGTHETFWMPSPRRMIGDL